MKMILMAGLLLLASSKATAYSIAWSKVAGGGTSGTLTTDGLYSIGGTVGQHDAASRELADAFSITGGFWAFASLGVGDHAPNAGPDSLVRLSSSTVAKVPLSVLLANDSDADGDTLTISAVSDAQPAGATVAILGGWVVYTVPTSGAGNGSFRYTLSDGTGLESTGTATVVATTLPVPGTGPNAVSVTQFGEDLIVSFIGVPGSTYRVQFSTDTAAPYAWQDFDPPADHVAPETGASGVFGHTDVSPPEALRFYRAILIP